MSHLIALVFDDQFKGEEARAALHRMAGEGLLDISDTVLITRNAAGKTVVSQEDKVIRKDQKPGHIAGLVAAAATGTMPFILAGTLAGRLVGRLMDHGITRKFVKDLKEQIQPGTSAQVLLGASDPDRRQAVEERMRGFGAKMLESDLPPEVQEEIESEIERQKAA
jgi:uncharacterized membrane protein